MTEPYYSDEWVTLYHGDALDVLPTLEAVELVIADPPYNAGFDYGALVDDRRPVAEYAAWCREWFGLVDALARRIVIFPGHGNMPVWWDVKKPSGFGCWYKPGNPAGGGIVNFCEWEPWLYWGPFLGGSDVIRATVSKQLGVGTHPCPKPLSLYRTLIARTKAEVTLDPFAGSGTTLRAAKDLGRKSIGIEIEERYCEIAANRLAQEVLAL